MKITKLLSVMMMMNDEFHFAHFWKNEKEQMMKSVNDLYDRVLGKKGIVPDFHDHLPSLPDEKISIELTVVNEKGEGITSQVKFFPVATIGNPDNYSKADHRIDMTLRQTGLDGKLSATLPRYIHKGFEKGNIEIEEIKAYVVEVSKGSEFEVIERLINVDHSGEIFAEVVSLKQFIKLNESGWYGGDLHHHSIYSSPKFGGTDDVVESAEEVRTAMMAMGLSYGALSDHHNILNHHDWLNTETEGFLPIPSKEISTSNGHVMSLNVLTDVIYDIPTRENRSEEYLFREFVRITDEIKSQGGLAQINHPKDLQQAISLPEYMEKHIELFDTMEIWNGSIPMYVGTTNFYAYQFWLKLLRQDRFIPATTGSDTHNIKADDYHHLMNEILWVKYHLKKRQMISGVPPESEKKEIGRFIKLVENTADLLEIWAEKKLGTGCVRTYINTQNKIPLEPSSVLKGLKRGNSFLTNGPILIPTIEGKGCGERFCSSDESLQVHFQIACNRPVKSLEVIGKNGQLQEIDVSGLTTGVVHNLFAHIKTEQLENEDWIICRIYADYLNMAISNPIFISKGK